MKLLLIILAIVAVCLFTTNAFAKDDETFVRRVEGGGSVYDTIRTTDGELAYLNGFTLTRLKSLSGQKTAGDLLSLNLSNGGYAQFSGLARTTGGFVIVGYAQLTYYYGPTGATLIQLDSQGVVQWNKIYTVANGNIVFNRVTATADGGFIVTGGAYPPDWHPIVIKFNGIGEPVWSKSFDGLSSTFRTEPTLDGGVLIAADILDSNGQPLGVDLVKINSDGNISWEVGYDKSGFAVQSITALNDQGFLIAGSSTRTPHKMLLIRLNADGTIRTKAAYLLKAPHFFISNGVSNPDGGAAIGGSFVRKSSNTFDGFLMKLNADLSIKFQKRLGFRVPRESIDSVFANENGSYLLVGSTGQDTLLASLNDSGVVPGCSFSHDFFSRKTTFGGIKIRSLITTPSSYTLPSPTSMTITSKRLNSNISNACVN